LTKIATVSLSLDPPPDQAWADDFGGFDWTAATGIAPEGDPKLAGDIISFPDRNAARVLEAVRSAIDTCDQHEAARA
jgi:hypothetical protein